MSVGRWWTANFRSRGRIEPAPHAAAFDKATPRRRQADGVPNHALPLRIEQRQGRHQHGEQRRIQIMPSARIGHGVRIAAIEHGGAGGRVNGEVRVMPGQIFRIAFARERMSVSPQTVSATASTASQTDCRLSRSVSSHMRSLPAPTEARVGGGTIEMRQWRCKSRRR